MGEPKKLEFLWFRDFRTCPRAPESFWFVETPGSPRQNKTLEHVLNILLLISKLGIPEFWKMWKTGAIQRWRSVQYILEHLGYGLKIYQKIWKDNFSIGTKYLLKKTLKDSLNPWSQETKKLWNRETKNQETEEHVYFQVKESPVPLNIPIFK